MAKKIAVIGGGIVGVCSALDLQQAGHEVTLIDRKQPGRETSYGNAGVLSDSSVLVINNPSLLRRLPGLMRNQSTGLRYNPLFVLKRLPWVLRFLSYCTKSHAQHAASALRALQLLSIGHHKAWIKEAKVDHLLRYAGWMKLFRTQKGFEGFAPEIEAMTATGVKFTVYEREQIRQLEPGLEPIYEKAVLMDETCGVSSPAELTDAYLAMFTAAGGTVIKADVTGLVPQDSGFEVRHNDGAADFDEVVVAAGPWSADVAKWVGYDVPLGWERGYHMHLEPDDVPQLGRAAHDVEGGFAIAPMKQGVRITSGVEFEHRDAPPDYTQIKKAVAEARKIHKMKGEVDAEPWMGRRPTLIDSLPIVGPAPRHKGLWFNFGHQHRGLSMAPGSAKLITSMINDEAPPIDASPYRADRFPV